MTTNQSRDFRAALGQFATGVTVVTAKDAEGNNAGMTANSFSSVSLDPMLVLWSVGKASNNFEVFNNAKHYAIHVLSAEQEVLSNQFASLEGDRFAGVELEESSAGVPLMKEYLARFECTIEHKYDGGDHLILVGRVNDYDYKSEGKPLLFASGKYAQVAD